MVPYVTNIFSILFFVFSGIRLWDIRYFGRKYPLRVLEKPDGEHKRDYGKNISEKSFRKLILYFFISGLLNFYTTNDFDENSML